MHAHDERVHRPRRAHVEEAVLFGVEEGELGPALLGPVGRQGEHARAAIAARLEDRKPAARRVTRPLDVRVGFARVAVDGLGEDDDGRLEALRPVDVHHADRIRTRGVDAHFLELERLLDEAAGDVREGVSVGGEPSRPREDLEQVSCRRAAALLGRDRGGETEALDDPHEGRGGRERPAVAVRVAQEPETPGDLRIGVRIRVREEREPPACLAVPKERVVVHAAKRPGEEGDHGDLVVRVVHGREERLERDEPAGDRERLAPRDLHRDAGLLERACVLAEGGALRREDENVRGARRDRRTVRPGDLPAARERVADERGDVQRVPLPDAALVEGPVADRGDPERAVARAFLGAARVELRERGLHAGGPLREDPFERRVDGCRDRVHGPEARRERKDVAARGVHDVPERLVRLDVGAPEAVDRLLRVADDEERPGPRADAPSASSAGRPRPPGTA